MANSENEIHDMLREDMQELRRGIKDDMRQYHTSFTNQVDELKTLVTPVVETYTLVFRVGRFIGKLAGWVSLAFGIVLGYFQLIKLH